jgi:hypothetical protein
MRRGNVLRMGDVLSCLHVLADEQWGDKILTCIPLSGTALQEVTRPTLLSHKVST